MPQKEVRKSLQFLPIFAVLMLSLALSFSLKGRLDGPTELVFSENSLQALKELNFENQMLVSDLTSIKRSNLLSELGRADALYTGKDTHHRGLIASVEGGDLLLMEPAVSLEQGSLQQLAEDYENAVPEFERVEVDQDLSIQSSLREEIDLEALLSGSEALVEPLSAEPLILEEVKVAVIDSGIDQSHEIFTGHPVFKGWNTLDHEEEPFDDVGHGTHIAGIIALNSPHAVIIPYKIVGAKGGRLSNVIEAMTLAMEDGVHIMNTSFGVMSPSFALEETLKKVAKSGIIVISAAGNNANSLGFYPATYEETIAVASVNSADEMLPRSNFGSWVDVAANGYFVRSALPGNKYGPKTGTSQSTARVSAAAAEWFAREGVLTLDELLLKLKQSPRTIQEGKLAGTAIVE